MLGMCVSEKKKEEVGVFGSVRERMNDLRSLGLGQDTGEKKKKV